MEAPSPARLYASLAGALLLVLGIVGFFYTASFAGLDDLEPALGVLDTNAWLNLLYVLTGAVGLLVAGVASRRYSLVVGLLYTLLAILDRGTGWLHLLVGLLGLAAAAGTAKPARTKTERPRSEPRAKAAAERA
jgi:hypothetical protein